MFNTLIFETRFFYFLAGRFWHNFPHQGITKPSTSFFAIRSDGLMMKTIAYFPYPDSVIQRIQPFQKQELSLNLSFSLS